MMPPLLAALSLAVAAMQATTPAEPPAILQVYREPLKPGVRAEYDRLETDTARQCARLGCPHPYLGLESLIGPKEVWWLNGYDSDADRKQVADAWAASTEVLALLGRNGKRKATLVGKPVESLAIVSARTRAEADAVAAGSKARVFETRPSWSHADEAWIAADPELWR